MSSSSTELPKGWIFLSGVAVNFQLLRLSIDFITTASHSTKKDYKEDHHNATTTNTVKNKEALSSESLRMNGVENSHYGSIESQPRDSEPLLLGRKADTPSQTLALLSFWLQCAIVLLLFLDVFLQIGALVPSISIWTALVVVALNSILTVRDQLRQRFGVASRIMHCVSACAIEAQVFLSYYGNKRRPTFGDEMVFSLVSLYAILSLAECILVRLPNVSIEGGENSHGKKKLSRKAMMTMLRPYFWPDETSDSALLNRFRAIMTWVCVIASRICNVTSPLYIGWASTALAHGDYGQSIQYVIVYAMLTFFGSVFKEGQSLIYLKVKQAAFVQLSESVFAHLHALSLDWHLRKKLGEVIRSMDRGIAACDSLMTYVFLWLIPALAECLIVCFIFATYFNYLPMAVSIFYFIWCYMVWTILVTLWRKKFRKAVVKSDNEWHDRCTDSLLNFETVKYFTAEDFECRRFSKSLKEFQQGSVNVKASLSFLNISQRLILQTCLAVALSLAAIGIKKRIDCCILHGCDSGVSECCQAIDNGTCPGMQVGDFVAVLAYVTQIFQPLNFLGSVYNAIVMAIIDLTHLIELLAESPDVQDAKDAMSLPIKNHDDSDIAVEFDNVSFHYPTQGADQGLKGVSFKMKRGTTTAIVGPTGSGKTTISRLFFRFYDVLGGAVRVNGKDVRTVSQKSLRSAIGVVPQNVCMFNESIRANLKYGRRDATQEELEKAAEDAQLQNFISSLDDGWDTVVGDRGLKLSGGEQQRTAIARCLIKDPSFVLLDEATSALDTLTENSIQIALERLGNQRTVMVIAHRLGTIRNADNILVLKDGIVAEEGTHDELINLNGVYAEMWTMQLHSSNTGSQKSLSQYQ